MNLRQYQLKAAQAVMTCVPESIQSSKRKKKFTPTPAERFMIDILQQAMKEYQHYPPAEVLNEPSNHLKCGQNVCPISQFRSLYISRKVDDRTKPDSARRAFGRYTESLQIKKIIRIYGEFVWFTD
jgi:hypothetical protein